MRFSVKSVLLGTNQIAGSAYDFNMNMINCVICCVRILLCCFSRVLKSLYHILALDANFELTVSILFSLPILAFVQLLCSDSGWLLLKWSAIGL